MRNPAKWPSLRIPFHRKLQVLWILAHAFLLWALVTDFSLLKLSISLVGTLFINIGSEAGAHRYFAHHSYTTTVFKKNLMIFLQTFAGEGSVLAFCGVHRQHHAHADQDLDPHSPVKKSSLSITYWLSTIHINPKYVKDCLKDPWVKWQHQFYFKVHALLLILVVIFFGAANYGYFFALPIVLILYGNAATNVIGHSAPWGYRNFPTEDASVNFGGILNFLLMGGGMQNNHHARPDHYSMKVEPGEHDSMGWIIRVFLKNKESVAVSHESP